MCVCVKERVCVSIYVLVGEREIVYVFDCVCVRERDRECVCVCERECVCVCLCELV